MHTHEAHPTPSGREVDQRWTLALVTEVQTQGGSVDQRWTLALVSEVQDQGGILVNLIIGDLIIGDTAMELGTPGNTRP